MSSPCPRLVRCRIKDLASCFYACRFPLEEESSDTILCSTTLPQMQHESIMDANSKCSNKTRDSCRKASVENIVCFEEEKRESSSAQSLTLNSTDDKVEVEEGSRDPKWPRFSEEDYIVFCFREDGAIHMINESKPSKTYDENNKKGEEEWSNEKESDRAEDEIKEIVDSAATIGAKGCEEESFESCNSNQSDTSTNSFSFPNLGIEWIGSPVHLPQSEKHEATSLFLHCCRF